MQKIMIKDFKKILASYLNEVYKMILENGDNLDREKIEAELKKKSIACPDLQRVLAQSALDLKFFANPYIYQTEVAIRTTGQGYIFIAENFDELVNWRDIKV